MFTLRCHSRLSSYFHNFHSNPTNRLSPLINFLFSLSLNRTYSSTPRSNSENHALFNFLTDFLKSPKQRALAITSRFSHVKSYNKPQAAIDFLKTHGFSDTQIRSLLNIHPKLLLSDVEKILKPKFVYFQELGVPRPHLAMFISKNPMLLSSSLNKRLKPAIELIKKVLELNQPESSKCNINDDLVRILSRYTWVIGPESKLLSSVKYLESCGIVGSQLVVLLKNEPRLFFGGESKLKSLISRVTELGFVMGSRMLVHGVRACYGNRAETLHKKYEVFQSFGFSKLECAKMIIKSPNLFKSSETRLRCGIEFFLSTLMLDKSVIVFSPYILMYSMEKRILPRHRVFQVVKSKRLVKRLPSISTMLCVSVEKFMKRYVLRFKDDAKELMLAYKGPLSEPSKV
ncbi:transcription termination factor MTEF1, chloroplastic-like [Primulina huaijiensis]|uniref:transcription termination factor MTEF1, chloroplastic-like n=1 Tax=Primulina huaijiensis TaxID=1492673 RepID=UPI003CC70E45